MKTIIRSKLDLSKPVTLTEEQLKMLEALKDRPITFDEDCPEQTPEQLKQFRRASDRRKRA